MRTSTFVILLVIIVLLAGASYYFLTASSNPGPAAYGGPATPSAPNTGGANTSTGTATGSSTGTGNTTTSVTTAEIATNSSIGAYLVAPNGMTLYTYANDAPDTTNCTGQCTTLWPPYTVLSTAPPSGGSGVMGTLGTITRPDDGSIQVTYNRAPLYFYAGDVNPGDLNGANIPKWKVAKP